MLDWLRRRPDQPLTITIAGQTLPLVITRLPQSRRMTLRLARDGTEVRISMPRHVPTQDAISFAKSRESWLAAQLARHTPAQPLADGARLRFRGVEHALRHDPASTRRVRAADGQITVGGAAQSLGPRLQRWLQSEARALFTADLAFYCARAEVPTPPLALSSAQARWGSCSARGAIRLNWRLIMAPDTVRRSVVAHEVAHLVHFNHSPAFHALLGDLFEGDLVAANRWLASHGRSLYTHFG
jgi:predicted metal-dependent hydrolase